MNTDNHYKVGEYPGTIEDILARHNEPEYRYYPGHEERNRKILKKQELEEKINIRKLLHICPNSGYPSQRRKIKRQKKKFFG